MSYVGLLYQDLIRKKDVLVNYPLPPIVRNIGDAKRTDATDIATLIPKLPGLVAKFLPKLEYLLNSGRAKSSNPTFMVDALS